jgi:hypothetical protein
MLDVMVIVPKEFDFRPNCAPAFLEGDGKAQL